ncbi:MAG: AgmX/PglI C-terminal domain-containing protein [Polyangiaceae bacterium]
MKDRSVVALSLVLGLSAVACAPEPGAPGGDRAPAPAASVTSARDALTDALADAETGKDPVATRARLEAALADASLDKKVRGEVLVALAGLVGGADKDRAADLLEQAVAVGDQNAESRLYALFMGHAPEAPRPFAAPVADSARALAKFFPAARPDNHVEIDIVAFGSHDSRASDSAGTYAIAEALREKAIIECGICDRVKTNIHTGFSRHAFWSAIPSELSRLDRALVVTYVTADTIPPPRYAKWLAADVAEIQAAFARGDGLFAVKTRPNAPPLVTIAAPYTSRLAAVEASLAAVRELPKGPVVTKLPRGLTPDEIRAGVREHFAVFRGCYEGLLTRRPAAGGKIEVGFTVPGSGGVTEPVVTFEGNLEEPEFRTCVDRAIRTLRYPIWSSDPAAKVTVKYPIVFSP